MRDNLKDIRQDIFDIETVPKVLYVYRGDTFELDLDLTISASELNTVVLNCDGLPEATPLTLLESTTMSSKWHLVLNKTQTLILIPKTHNFTITIVKTDGTELTLYKGIIAVNNRVYSNYSNNYYIAALLKQAAPTVSDNDYLIGTMWVNVLTGRVYFLISVVNNEAKWIEYSEPIDKMNTRIDNLEQAVSEIDQKDTTVLQQAKDYTDDRISEEITAEKVKQLYESNSDTNVFTDAEKAKLAGIELGAEVNTVNPEDLVADNISFDGSETNFLAGEANVEGAIKELDARVKTNADNVALKVNTSDIVDNLTSTDVDKPLSANQGKVLKDTVDLLDARVDDLELETERLDDEVIRVEQKVDAHVEDLNNPHGVTAEQVDTYVKATIDSKDASTLQEAKDFTYSRIDIDSKDAAVLAEAKEYADDRISEEMTAEKVKQLYEANPDTNAFTDLEKAKLSGIEEGAQVNTVSPEDLDADNIRFDGSDTHFLGGETRVAGAIERLDAEIVNSDEFFSFEIFELRGKVEVVEDRIEAIEDDISSNYYDKTEIDDMIGDIETLLEGI